MNLSDYIADEARKQALATAVGKNSTYLWQVATGWRGKRASPKLAQAIERATGGQVRCGVDQGMRSDLQWIRDQHGNVTGYYVPASREAA